MDHVAPRIGVVHAPRPIGEVTRSMIDVLQDSGASVEVLAGGAPIDVSAVGTDHNLYVLKHSYGTALTLGAALHAAGARTLNPYPAVAVCRDKAVVGGILARGGLPVPRTHFVIEPEMAAPLLNGGPLVLKPNSGSKGRGVVVVRTEAELASIDPAGGPFIAQDFHPPDGLDRKLYRIGDQIFCVGRPWPADTAEAKQGMLLEVDDVLRRLTLAVGDALGIDIYGVDVVVSDRQHYVVDVSAFPGFKGVPDAGRLLADRILAELVSDPTPTMRSNGIPWQA